MLERIDTMLDSALRARSLIGFDINKCPKADQVNNLNEASAWLLDIQSGLEALRREERVHQTAHEVWTQARRKVGAA